MIRQESINIIESEEESTPQGKAKKTTGRRIGYYYIILKSLKESRKNDVVKCLYIKGIMNFGFCVIKEGTYGDSKDNQGRDIKERLLWQKKLHEQLQHKVRVPKLLGSFEENGNYYLVIEYIRGKPLIQVLQEQEALMQDMLLTGNINGIRLLNSLLRIIKVIEALHSERIVHRDITSSNFIITKRGKVALIDMELSYSLKEEYPTPPFMLGTVGFMSPEQEITSTPTIKEDIFSVGAILFHAFTEISPSKLVKGATPLSSRIEFFVPDASISSLISQCMNPDPERRPDITIINKTLNEYKKSLLKKSNRPVSRQTSFSNDEVLDTIQQVINTLGSPLMADPERGWFSEHLDKPRGEKSTINKAWYASFNRGASGVMYFLSLAKSAGLDTTPTAGVVSAAMELIRIKYIENQERSTTGLHFGSDGVAAALSTSMQYGLIPPDKEYETWINKLLERKSDLLNITHGLSGQGIANLICAPYLSKDTLHDRLMLYAGHILDKQEKDGSWNIFEKRFTRGFATGAAGIIYFLLTYGEKKAVEGGLRGLHWLISKSHYKGNAAVWRSSKGKQLLPWWSDGAAGIALPFLKAYSITGDPIFKRYSADALKVHHPEVLYSDLSQYNGLSGLGETYLEAFKILGEDEWIKRANHIVQVIMHLRKKDPAHGLYWLVSHEKEAIANFMVGNSGLAHFLLHYCNRKEIGLPLL